MLGKILRFMGIILMGLTAVFTLLSGAGTTCVALAAETYGPMAVLAPYKWLYVIFVLSTLGIGVMGIRAVVLLIKARSNAYRWVVMSLVSGLFVGGIHMGVSRSLRGSSMPVDAVVYTTVVTLIVFLIFRIPGIWEQVKDGSSATRTGRAGGVSATLCSAGICTLTVQLWVGPTHTWNGVNYADLWHSQLNLIGWGLVLVGVGYLVVNPFDLKLRGLQLWSRPAEVE